ncbi:MAG TPA: hypothetical protein PK961_11360 [bacterium]|nr:hypothetical protein [bacterium]
MFLKYYLGGILQLLLLIFAAPVVIGFFAGLLWRGKAQKHPWYIAGGLIALLNIAVLIDKGVPFFGAQVINAYLYAPMATSVYFLVGLAAEAALLLSFHQSVKTGIRSGLRVAGVGQGAEGKVKAKAKAKTK